MERERGIKITNVDNAGQCNSDIVRHSYLLSLNCGTEYIHNAGTQYEHGWQCSDCGRFIKKGTLEYFMTSGVMDIWMAIHNRRAEFCRKGIDNGLHQSLKELMEKLENKDALINMTEAEAQKFMDETYKVLSRHKILDDEATEMLG